MSQFKVGDKVVPHDKSTGCPFNESDFKKYEAKYLIVVNTDDPDGDIQADTPEGRGAEYYRPEDLTLYQEPTTVEEPSKLLREEVLSKVVEEDTKEFKFEVGKWYQSSDWCTKQDYAKALSGDSDGRIDFEENIDRGHYGKGNGSWSGPLNTYREVPLEEIQQYLPEGHPDRFDTALAAKKVLEPTPATEVEDPLIVEARRRYPIGTKFYPAHLTLPADRYCTITTDKFHNSNGSLCAIPILGDMHCATDRTEGDGNSFSRVIYEKSTNRWAEIVNLETLGIIKVNKTHQHSVGDYFVALEENVYGILIPIGGIGRITKLESEDGCYGCEAPIGHDVWCLNDSVANIKWFKPLEEATKFSESIKTIPVIEKPEVYKEAIYNARDRDRGKRIIEFLISKGGVNKSNWKGDATNVWWYIKSDGNISVGYTLPEDYTENTSFEPSKGQPLKEVINPKVSIDRESICSYCKDTLFDGSVNTGPHNLCEGSKCKEAEEGYMEESRPKPKLQEVYKGEAVQCTTQKEWDTVLSVFNPRNLRSPTYRGGDCIVLTGSETCEGTYDSPEYMVENKYRIISFKEWCDRNGVTPEPKPVEGLEFQEEVEEYAGICVHCRTQEQWDIVTKTLNIVWGDSSKWGMHRENTVIFYTQQNKQYSSLGYAKGNNYKLLSFEEWEIENMCVGTNETFPKASKVEGYSVDNSNPLFPKIKFN